MYKKKIILLFIINQFNKSANHVRNVLNYDAIMGIKCNTIKTYPDNLTSSFEIHINYLQKSWKIYLQINIGTYIISNTVFFLKF